MVAKQLKLSSQYINIPAANTYSERWLYQLFASAAPQRKLKEQPISWHTHTHTVGRRHCLSKFKISNKTCKINLLELACLHVSAACSKINRTPETGEEEERIYSNHKYDEIDTHTYYIYVCSVHDSSYDYICMDKWLCERIIFFLHIRHERKRPNANRPNTWKYYRNIEYNAIRIKSLPTVDVDVAASMFVSTAVACIKATCPMPNTFSPSSDLLHYRQIDGLFFFATTYFLLINF